MFRLVGQRSDARYGIQTTNGHYVTALGGGGKYLEDNLPDILHTDATSVGSWEKWRPLGQPGGSFVLQTSVGKCLSVPNGKMHTAGDAIAAGPVPPVCGRPPPCRGTVAGGTLHPCR
jgi:hypothetical protein